MRKTPTTRKMTIVAQDPSLLEGNRIVTAQVDIPYEDLTDGPRGYRVHVVDYDASTDTLYKPLPSQKYENGADPFAGATNEIILGDPNFHAQNVYAIVMRTLARFEKVLGRRVSWSFHGHQLHVSPHAFAGANAFYSRKDRLLAFGYFPSHDGKRMVFSGLSHDVIVHETTHALIDGLRERYTDPSSPQQAAFHEGFADVVALLSAFSIPAVLSAAFHDGKKNSASVPRSALTVEALKNNVLLGLAEEMGSELTGMRGNPLRRSATMKPSQSATRGLVEPHELGEIFVAAMINAFLAVWSERLAGLGDRGPSGKLGEGPLSKRRVMEEGAAVAGRLLKICIRAIDYAPVVDLLFGDFLSAALTADYELVPDDTSYGFREKLRKAFADWGIEPSSNARNASEPGLWQTPEQAGSLDYSNTHFESMQQDPDEVFRFIWENRKLLDVHEHAYSEVLSVRPCKRVGPDGFILHETVAEYRQILTIEARELQRFKLKKPAEMPGDQEVRLFGGGVLIFNEYGRLKYHVRTRVASKRQQDRLDYLWKAGYFVNGGAQRSSFSQLHLDRMKVWPLGARAEEEI